MKIVIAIILLHYNVACLRAQMPNIQGQDYIHDYYEGEGANNNGNGPPFLGSSEGPDSDYSYGDDNGPVSDKEIQFWETLLNLLKNKYPSLTQPNQQKMMDNNGKNRGQNNRPQQHPQMNNQQGKYPNSQDNLNPYQQMPNSNPQQMNQNQPMPTPNSQMNQYQPNSNLNKQSCMAKKSLCLKRCRREPRCVNACKTRHKC